MSFDKENLGYLHKRLIHGKDKCEKFLKQREFHLDIKCPKGNQVQLLNETRDLPPEYNFITNDIWYHVSKFIPPDYVQTFALICTQTAALVRRKSFWMHLYLKYCQQSDRKMWILKLPEHLQLDHIRNYNASLFRASVIQALFYSYPPLMRRTDSYNYNLDILVGRTFISAWHKYDDCMWVTCYQLNSLKKTTCQSKRQLTSKSNEIVNNWESLASDDEKSSQSESDDDENDKSSNENPYEGVCLLLIFCRRFIPLPDELTYEAKKLRLSAIRRPLTSDMREYNLELDFVSALNKEITAIKYPTVKNPRVLPWWHPEFKKCIRFEAHDTFS